MSYIKGAGKLLREYREKKGISRKILAKKLNINPHTVYSWEQGLSRIDTFRLIQLAKEFDIPADAVNDLAGKKIMKSPDPPLSLDTGIRVGDSSAEDFVNMLNAARGETNLITEPIKAEKNDILQEENDYMKDFKLIKANEVFECLRRHERVLVLNVFITAKSELGWKTFEMLTSSVEKVLEMIENPNVIFIVKK